MSSLSTISVEEYERRQADFKKEEEIKKDREEHRHKKAINHEIDKIVSKIKAKLRKPTESKIYISCRWKETAKIVSRKFKKKGYNTNWRCAYDDVGTCPRVTGYTICVKQPSKRSCIII